MMNIRNHPFLEKFYPIGSALMLALILSQPTSASELKNDYSNPNTSITQQKITGIVSTEGSPLQGITVSVLESPNLSTSTDINGRFSITASIGQTLVFKGIGFHTLEKLLKTTPCK